MKKRRIIFAVAFIVIAVLLCTVGCNKQAWTLSSAYQKAQSDGFYGTYEEYLKFVSGINSVQVDDDGRLQVTLGDGTVVDAGNVRGETGVGVDDVTAESDRWGIVNTLKFTLSDGTVKTVEMGKGVNADRPYRAENGDEVAYLVEKGATKIRFEQKEYQVTKVANAEQMAEALEQENRLVVLVDDVVTDSYFSVAKNSVLCMNKHSVVRTGGKTAFNVTSGSFAIFGDSLSTVNGTLVVNGVGASLLVDGGTYSASVTDDCAIQTNGSKTNQSVTVKNATVNSTDDTLYLAGDGEYLVQNSVINGYTGIYMKAGKLTVKDSEINAVGASNAPVANGNGANSTGDGIVLDSKQGYVGNMQLVVGQNVSVSSANGYAIREALTDVSSSSAVSIIIDGDANFSGAKGKVLLSDAFRQAVEQGNAVYRYDER